MVAPNPKKKKKRNFFCGLCPNTFGQKFQQSARSLVDAHEAREDGRMRYTKCKVKVALPDSEMSADRIFSLWRRGDSMLDM